MMLEKIGTNLPQVIHIMGASGSGTSTLARALENTTGLYKWIDLDDISWMPTNPPYQFDRPANQRATLLGEALDQHPHCVMAGDMCSWGDLFIPQLDLVVWLQVPTDVRLERLKQREAQDFGVRILPGGDMHQNFINFLANSAQYDTGNTTYRTYTKQEQWVRGLSCPVMIWTEQCQQMNWWLWFVADRNLSNDLWVI